MTSKVLHFDLRTNDISEGWGTGDMDVAVFVRIDDTTAKMLSRATAERLLVALATSLGD